MRFSTVARSSLAGITALALAAATASCSSSSGGGSSTGGTESGCQQADLIQEMSLSRRAGQLLMGGINADIGDAAIQATVESIAKGHVGGVNFLGNSFGYSDNQLAQAVDAGGAIPPFLAIDQEGGRVQRLADTTEDVPSARVMAKTMTPEQVQRLAETIGKKMTKRSLNMDLAPVVDVTKQDDWEVVGDRSFGKTPEQVTEYAGAFAAGLRDAGIYPVLKHFPGLGTGSGNTDYEKAHTAPLSRLEQTDLIPYETLLQEKPVAVMLTNASVPGLSKGKPATLAPAAYQLLREQFGYNGVAMTDSLSPLTVQTGKDMPTLAVRALAAGADVALWDGLSEAPEVQEAIVDAVKQGKLEEDRVNESVERVLTLKGVDLCQGR